jgi:steroid 5-alpha reductase family enzyme
MNHLSISRARIRKAVAGRSRTTFFLQTRRCVLFLVVTVIIVMLGATVAAVERCASTSTCSSLFQPQKARGRRRQRRILQQHQNPTFSVTSTRILETRGGTRDSSSSSTSSSSSDSSKDNDRHRRDHRKRTSTSSGSGSSSSREDNSSSQKKEKKKKDDHGDEQPKYGDDETAATAAARPEINAQLQQQQQQQQHQQHRQHHQRQVIHYIIERLALHGRRFLERSMTRDNLQALASKAGPTILALIFTTTWTSSRRPLSSSSFVSLWDLYAWTLVGSSAGFFLFLYFTSVGYALAIGLPLLVLMRSSNTKTSTTTSWHSIMVILWSIRTVAFLLWREYYNWPALHKRIVQVNDDPQTAPDLLVKVLCWFAYSFFYLCMLSPCYYRHKQQQQQQQLLSTISSSSPPLLLQPPPRLSLWLQVVGLLLESIADAQKSLFKAYPFQRYDWCHTGLWNWSTHPNYLGEWLFWLGTLLGGRLDRPLSLIQASTSTSSDSRSSSSSSTTTAMINGQLAAAVSNVKNGMIGMSTTNNNMSINAMKKNLIIPPFLPPEDELLLSNAVAVTAAAAAAAAASRPSFWRTAFAMLWSCALQGTGFLFISIILRGAVDSLDRRHLEKYGTATTSRATTSPITSSSSTDSEEMPSQQDEFRRYRQSIGLWGPKRSWWMAQWQQQRPVVSAWYNTFVADIGAQIESSTAGNATNTTATTTTTANATTGSTGDEYNKNGQEAGGGGELEDQNPDSLS